MTTLFTVTYFIVISVVLCKFFLYLIYQPRKAILAGVVFTSLTLSALPWQLLPFRGIASALQLSFILGAILIFLSRSEKKVHHFVNIYSLLFYTFIFIMVLFLFISPSVTYGISKILILILRAALPILALYALAPIQQSDAPLLFNTIIIGSTMSSLNLLSFSGLESERAGFENLYAITAGREAGLGVALILVYFSIGLLKLPKAIIFIFPFIISALGTIITGSRGPILAPLFTVICTFLFAEYNLSRRIKFLIRVALFTASIILVYQLLGERTQNLQLVSLNRVINRLTTLGNNRSDQGRTERYQIAWEGFVESNGIGKGTGSFDYFFKRDGKTLNKGLREYPHNIFLEVAFELGWVGLIVFGLITAITLYTIVKFTRSNPTSFHVRALYSLYFFSFFNALVSSDIAGNYSFWIIGCLPWLINVNSQFAQNSPATKKPLIKLYKEAL